VGWGYIKTGELEFLSTHKVGGRDGTLLSFVVRRGRICVSGGKMFSSAGGLRVGRPGGAARGALMDCAGEAR